MTRRLTLGHSAPVQPTLLEDSSAVAHHLPKLMGSQVARLLAEAQRSGQTLDWATLTVVLRPDPVTGFLITASAAVAE